VKLFLLRETLPRLLKGGVLLQVLLTGGVLLQAPLLKGGVLLQEVITVVDTGTENTVVQEKSGNIRNTTTGAK
jgi:hypothetical protein